MFSFVPALSLRVKTETEIADERAGFRQGRETRDQITNLRMLMYKAREHQQPLYGLVLCGLEEGIRLDLGNYDEHGISSALD